MPGTEWIGDAYVILWELAEIAAAATDDTFRECLPGVPLVGGDGGGECFGFRGRDIVMLPTSLELAYAVPVADSLHAFLLLTDCAETGLAARELLDVD